MGKKILIIVFIVFIAMQFFQPTLPDVSKDNSGDLITNNPTLTKDVADILKNSCYDCHSNETVYPWYSKISPVSFLLVRDIKEGRKELNFSEWEEMSKLDKLAALDDIQGVLIDNEMPMKIYTLIHTDASLSDAEHDLLINWTDQFTDKLFE